MCSPNQVVLQKKRTSPRKRVVTLQRHSTLPGPLRSLPSLSSSSVKKNTLKHNKKNPYVGWFRHSPPTTIKRRCLLVKTRTPLAPVKTTDARTLRRNLLHGYLRGGTVWWLDDAKIPPQEDASDAETTLGDGETVTLVDDEVYDLDDEASIRSETRLDLYVNSQERLDYDITQMDIVRMNRVASRHLDVESIANLPVVTYQKADPKQRRSEKASSKAFSWMLVHSDSETSDDDNDDEVPVCIICCEQFSPGDRLRVLPCEHSFHTGCIDRWLSGSNSTLECFTAGCPTCKKRIPTQSYFRVGDALASHSFVA